MSAVNKLGSLTLSAALQLFLGGKILELQTFMTKIHLPKEEQAFIKSYPMTKELLAESREILQTGYSFFGKFLQTKKPEEALVVVTLLASEYLESYQKKSYSEEIFLANFLDITIWAKRYRLLQGKIGLMEVWWVIRPFYFYHFRLGRLQFEPATLQEEIPEIPKETFCLQIHIPEDGPLLSEDCQDSLTLALQFFKRSFDKERLFLCESWLLSPSLEKLLPANSHILAFQKRFTLLHTNYQSSQAEERVFGKVLENPKSYLPTTTLAKNLQTFLLNGGKVGEGFGYLIL